MERKNSIFISWIILLICGVPVLAQQPAEGQTVKIETTLVTVPVIVSDKQGRYVSGLKQADFTLYHDRIHQQIDFFADTEEPVNIALLLDTSRSTEMVLVEIKQAAMGFLRQLRASDRALIASFDFRVNVLAPLTGDRARLERAVSLAAIGERLGTRLREAVDETIRHEFKSVKGRKAIIVLTDGKDQGSFVTEEELIEAASEADAPVYSIFYTTGPGARPDFGGWPGGIRRRATRRRMEQRNQDAAEFLQQLSEASAGRYFRSEVAVLGGTLDQIFDELRHQYRLGFYPSEADPPDAVRSDAQVHQLRVEVARAGVVVRARRGYRMESKKKPAEK
jgi:Ca-activated chloride channel family protein